MRITDPVFFVFAVSIFSSLAEQPGIEQRLAAFWALDSTIRTFKAKAKDLAKASSTSLTMSSAQKSASKSASKFDLGDIDNMISPRSLKKELAKGPSQPKPKTMSTRARTGSKRKKPGDYTDYAFQIECHFHDVITEGFVHLQAIQERNLAEAEEKLADLCKIAAAKDKKLAQLEKEKTGLDEQLMFVEIGIHKAQFNASENAKVCAARTVLQARIKMAEEAMDPAFDR
ncbi:hypothetical protein Hdeb2414_s0003g00105131 [Helianthus debilis subsp. tardiflorus]